MPNTLQTFLADATQKAADELVAAFLRLPEDKRAWQPAETSRTALNQMAECALLTGYNVSLIETRQWPNGGFEEYMQEKAILEAKGWDAVHALLQENTPRMIAILSTIPDEELDQEIQMPWGSQTLASILAYPYWNMSYHQGQINYIASLLNCLN